jgi:hypothetical protein
MAIRPESLKNLVPVKPGQVLNPVGKVIGTRDGINKRFLNALAADFDEHGKQAIVACREKDPTAYIKVVAALQPKEFVITRPLEGLSDDELAVIAEQLRSGLGAPGLRAGDRDPQEPETAH